MIGFTFSAYHAVKPKFRSGQLYNASHTMTTSQMRTNWSLFVEVLMAETGEAHVKYRALSLPRSGVSCCLKKDAVGHSRANFCKHDIGYTFRNHFGSNGPEASLSTGTPIKFLFSSSHGKPNCHYGHHNGSHQG